jgi:phosphoribosylanthranilate isomerase
MTRVKICGIRSVAEALAVCELGADAVGVLVGPHTEVQQHFVASVIAREILTSLPPFTQGVLVTTSTSVREICELITLTSTSVVQIHNELPTTDLEAIRAAHPHVRVIGVATVVDETSILYAQRITPHITAVLLDSAKRGSMGSVHDWTLSDRIAASLSVPTILAGGLNPENIERAIESVHPYAVDVRSGVCDHTGSLDLKKVAQFITNAKRV